MGRIEHLATCAAAALAIGCAPSMRVPASGGDATLRIQPVLLGQARAYRVQADDPPDTTPLATDSVEHVLVTLSTVADDGEHPVLGSEGAPVQKDVGKADFGKPLVFRKLHHKTHYRIRGFAYSAPGTASADLISVPASSTLDVEVGLVDTAATGILGIQLIDVPFEGLATMSFDFDEESNATDAATDSVEGAFE